MINLADEIVTLVNYIRPKNDKILRDSIFTKDHNYQMELKPGGIEYLKSKVKGYISYYRGSIPYTFADRIDKGEILPELLFTPLVRCYMEKFQDNIYKKFVNDKIDYLDNNSMSISNFVYPFMKDNDIIGIYNNIDIQKLIYQIENSGDLLRKTLNEKLFNNKISKHDEYKLIYIKDDAIIGDILKKENLKIFSSKFYETLNNLDSLVNKKSCTAFIYSNLVKTCGIQLFAEILKYNGYLEYKEKFNEYIISNNTQDYKTGLPYSYYISNNITHEFRPATFLLVTGDIDNKNNVPEINQKIIRNVFNSKNNIFGKDIKFILGSKVMNEGITLKNCKEVHILDIFYNLPKIEQVIGRAARMCVHMDSVTNENKYPYVNIYRYTCSIKNSDKLSTDELLYKKAELKYLTIKKVERAIKEVSIDCPLLLNNNIFQNEYEKYKNCVHPLESKDKKNLCPAICDFEKCDYKCDEKSLDIYWNEKEKKYNDIDIKYLNNNTFKGNLFNNEIDVIVKKIISVYRYKYVYTYNELYNIVINSYSDFQKQLFDPIFINMALEKLLPTTDNNFDIFTNYLYDRYNKKGYLIQRGKYYIFQEFQMNEKINMNYREHYSHEHKGNISFINYLSHYHNDLITKNNETDEYLYDLDYYNNKKENTYIGIIDRNNNKLAYDSDDLFKIRNAIKLTNNKKRYVGLPTFKGTVCLSKQKGEIEKIAKSLHIKIVNSSKSSLCNNIKNTLLELEKYSIDNKSYVIIPKNHKTYQFPYNIHDRKKYIIELVGKDNVISSKKLKNGYEIVVNKNDDIQLLIQKYNYEAMKDSYKIIID